jgi:hypothetical protein
MKTWVYITQSKLSSLETDIDISIYFLLKSYNEESDVTVRLSTLELEACLYITLVVTYYRFLQELHEYTAR